MTRRLLVGAAALAIAYGPVAAAFAQTTPAPATTSGQHHTAVVYSGCLKSGSDLAAGSTLTPGTSTSAPLSGYVLTNAQLTPNTKAVPAPDAPSSDAGAGTKSGTMYRIVGMQEPELQRFVNQQVEIRGMMESSDTTATTGTTAAVATSSGSTPDGQPGKVPTFRATSIRVLSSTCGGGATS
jgi:hypothetical protein